MTDLSGIWVAIVTPFLGPTFSPAQGLGVDHAALRRLVEHLKQAEVTGLVALGSTGEPAALDDAEQDAVLDTVLDAAQGLPVIAGLAGNHVGHLHARLAHLNTLPLHAVLSPAPYYVRPSQAGLVGHFKALADASRAPLMLYDIPYRTGVQMDLDTLLTLAGHGHIIGIKDCGGSLDKTQQLIADGRLQVLSGEDALIFHNLCLGGAGAITAAAQVAPQAFMAMYRALREGRLATAREQQYRLAPLIRGLFAEPNPALVKAELARQGLVLPHLRAPLLEASVPAAQAVEACMHALAAGG
ncbi:4-hydroxy-tetrahydrodipicolinate synthase [Aquabacterium sp.]|uniref:4-hydroxy-tetrahydrodipicolinate synthase n=1 Tax=Aquabacterium sp. TaxID=1872578 RepID=UPI004037D008